MKQKQLKIRKKIPPKIKAKLQQEINSLCPICNNSDVEYFEIHHINSMVSDNSFENLILLCPNCHSKITKRDISQAQVVEIKRNLKYGINDIEFVNVLVNEHESSWTKNENFENAFYRTESNKSPYPIFDFRFLNNSQKTILLTGINLKVKHLYSGLSGIPQPCILKPITRYQLFIEKESNDLFLENPIQVPSKTGFRFEVEVCERNKDKIFTLDTRMTLGFTFIFNKNKKIEIPKIFINTEDEKDSITLITLE